jgi:hypothetical protein
VQLTASVGVAVPPADDDVAAADLLRFAEVAMHDAKRSSRGGVALATDGVVGSATRDLELEAELRAAIAANTLVLEYQPVVGPDGLVCTAEALVRWPHPEHGVIPPGEFLPIAQRGGTAARARRLGAAHGVPGGRRLAGARRPPGRRGGQPGGAAAGRSGVPGHRDRHRRVRGPALGPARARGRRDQPRRPARTRPRRHGTARPARRPVRHRRLRHGLLVAGAAQGATLPRSSRWTAHSVRGVATDPADFAVARAVVDMAKAMGRSTVAEGVETTEQYHVLRGVGVDAQQGWLFAAVAAAAAAARAARRRAGRGTGESGD